MDIILQTKQRHFSNITKQDLELIRSLANDVNLVIRPADKGGGIVLLNYCDYRVELLSQLQDTDTYTKLKGDPTA
ncbi:Hypothetical predicted protein, partial [Pelobates cultripes]